MTIQRWLREEPSIPTQEATSSAQATSSPGSPVVRQEGANAIGAESVVDGESPPVAATPDAPGATAWQARPTEPPPPPPWQSWQQVRAYRQDLHTHRFLMLRHPAHLDDDDRAHLTALLTGPPGEVLRAGRQFLEDWYAIARDEDGQRRCFADALERWRTWHENPRYRQLARLRRLLERMDEERAAKNFAFLRNPAWEATNNGAERRARQFRHLQAPCFGLRTEAAIAGTLKVDALRGQTRRGGLPAQVGRSGRGRRPQESVTMTIAA
jgi:hypothetical protein